MTGASSGIGRAAAFRLAADGFDLVLVARQGEVLRDLAADLADRYGVESTVLALDLAGRRGVEQLMVTTAALDIGLYVAAAGFGTSGPFVASDLERESQMLRLNVEAVLRTTHVLAGQMVKRGRGGIVLMSSLLALQGTPGAAHYAATKAWNQVLAEALYVELKPSGVDVVASAPGPVRSGFAHVANMEMGATTSPEQVVQGTFAALGVRPVALPGRLTRALTFALLPLPRRARTRAMGSVMARMTRGHPVDDRVERA